VSWCFFGVVVGLIGLSGIHGLVTRLMTRRKDSVVIQFGYSVGYNNSFGV